jgi:hypothetical protein
LSIRIEHHVIRANGSVSWTFNAAELSHDAEGHRHKLPGAMQNVTDREESWT